MWTTEIIADKEVDIFTPSEKKNGAIIYLHGHGEERLRDKPEFTALFEQHQRLVLCPRGKKSWWLDHVFKPFDEVTTPADYVRVNLLEWLESEHEITPPHIALFGISMGGQGAIQLAYRNARTFPIVVAIAPAIDFHTIYGRGYEIDELFPDQETARQETATLNIHPLNWPRYQLIMCDPTDPSWFTGTQRLVSKLSSSGLIFEYDLETSLGGHDWTYFTAMAEKGLEFMSNALDRM